MLLAWCDNSSDENKKDQDLWSALQCGQRKALSGLFEHHYNHLYNYGIKILPNSGTVNDAIQELFLNLWESHKHLSMAHSVKAYLLSSLRRLIVKQIKLNKSRAERNRNYIEDREETTFTIENLFISREIAAEQRQQLQKGLNTLTPRQKEVVFLKFYHGLSNKELVEVMEINYQSVRNLLYKALERLRSNMELVSKESPLHLLDNALTD